MRENKIVSLTPDQDVAVICVNGPPVNTITATVRELEMLRQFDRACEIELDNDAGHIRWRAGGLVVCRRNGREHDRYIGRHQITVPENKGQRLAADRHHHIGSSTRIFLAEVLGRSQLMVGIGAAHQIEKVGVDRDLLL